MKLFLLLTILSLLVQNSYESPVPYNNAFMYGNIYVRVIFVESIGNAADGLDWKEQESIEDWTAEQQVDITNRADAAFKWWEAVTPKAKTKFIVNYSMEYTKQEPVVNLLDYTWINEIGSKLYPQYSTNWFSSKFEYGTEDDRKYYNADNAFVVFVVNNHKTEKLLSRNALGLYLDDSIIVILTDGYSNTRYGFSSALAHEIGHIFGALDEYPESNPSCTELGGYLRVENRNAAQCPNSTDSIMKYSITSFLSYQNSSYTLAQVGYRDEDCDGIIEPLDDDNTNMCTTIYLPLMEKP